MANIYKLDSKNKYEGSKISIKIKKSSGYKVKPKNKVKYDGVVVNEMMVIKPSFIEKLLKRKINVKLNNYLQYIIRVLDDEETDSGKISTVLSDLNRYHEIIQNNYRQYLDEKYIELLLKKIELLKYELQKKVMYLNAYNYSMLQQEYEEEMFKDERKRSR